ncbi:hypothetical protein [Alkalibacillus silvisoli]|uniref:DUF2291 family protein n=1 Tax=Alkalibacillus silvisoli TaxID=392823 RepID=A0ABN1A0Z8_9BACI
MYKTVLFIIVALLTLSACNNDNTITSTDLSELENTILTVTSERSSVHEFNINDDYERVEVWVEKYVEGELVSGDSGGMRAGVQDDGYIIFGTEIDTDSKEFSYDLGVSSGGSIVSTKGNDLISEEQQTQASSWASKSSEEIPIDHEHELALAIATFTFSPDENMGMPADILSNFDEHKDQFDVAYVLKLEFLSEE